MTYTLGYVKIPTFGRLTIFHVVDNNFPIQQSGIFSSEFFSDNSTKIDYENQVFEVCGKRYSFRTGEVMAFAAGERKLFFARITNNIEAGYTPYITYGPGGAVIESGFVRNQNGEAYFFLTNAYDYPINIEIPVIKLMSVERYHEILSLEIQSEDKINAKKESESFVPIFNRNEKNASNHKNVTNEKNPSSQENFVSSFGKNEKNLSSQENFVSSFGKNEKNPSSQENYVSSFDKNEKNPSNHENVKKQKNPSSHSSFVSSFDKNKKNLRSPENFVSSCNKSQNYSCRFFLRCFSVLICSGRTVDCRVALRFRQTARVTLYVFLMQLRVLADGIPLGCLRYAVEKHVT